MTLFLPNQVFLKLIKKIYLLPILFLIFLLLIGLFFIHENPLQQLDPGTGKNITDIHVHVAGLGYGNSGCFIGQEMRDNIRFPFYLKALGVTEELVRTEGDKIIFKNLSQDIAKSQTVKQAVILAMDGYVLDSGEFDKANTHIYVPNDYVKKETDKYPNLLYGASINPNRIDAIQRLEQAKNNGALLIKWIPSIMNIDPANKKHVPFYQAMARLNIPLLTHTGMEKSFASARDELADPIRLKLPLSLGVTVIAAHIATTGKSDGEDNFERILKMFDSHPNLYADISSLTQANKLNFLNRALADSRLKDRLVYGTDWPLQFFPIISAWYHINHISFSNAWEASGIQNQWDRDVAIKVALGVNKEIFLKNDQILLSQ